MRSQPGWWTSTTCSSGPSWWAAASTSSPTGSGFSSNWWMSAGSATARCTCATAPRHEQTPAAPGRGRRRLLMRGWLGTVGPQRLAVSRTRLRSRVMGRFGAELQPFSDRGSPTIGSRRVGGGVSLWPSRVLLDQLRRLDQVSSANAWIRLGECLYRITLGLVDPDELAARSLGGV